MNKPLPEALFEAGVRDLISVTPPGAQLAPLSKLQPSQLGKVPGKRNANGTWSGYDWRKTQPVIDDVRKWLNDGANIGLRADHFPGVDIDCKNEVIAQIIEDAALGTLGPAAIRIGQAPKRLLMYYAAEPFSRMRLWIAYKGEKDHLVEMLGQGQQYLVYGTHPGTMRSYTWGSDPAASMPTAITREQADQFLVKLAEDLRDLGCKITREGDGRPITREAAGDQAGLYAPDLETLRAAVEVIPNTNDFFADRTSYLKMGYAIRAAAGIDEEEGFDIFAGWAAKWEGNDRVPGNEPSVVREDWRRMKGPYAVGWSWLAEQARGYGWSDAQNDFEAVVEEKMAEPESNLPLYSDQWLAERVVQRRRHDLRFIPMQGKWLVWNGARWVPDATMLAEDIIKKELGLIARDVLNHGGSDGEAKAAKILAMNICSGPKASTVGNLIKSDPAVAVNPDTLDHNRWIINTPAGIVDLRSGKLGNADPDQLCTKSTAVAPDFGGPCPEWRRFLAEATGGDRELEKYMQRLAGYALTGDVSEHHLTFIWGTGRNGKGTYLNAIADILGDYARVASMETFTATTGDKHTTDLAMLQGARLVTASETQAGKRWDEAKIKSLTGGDPITARFMRQDNFTFMPQFKLVFIGNHKPEIRNVDPAMQQRMHLVPFTIKPKFLDKQLKEKLQEEFPAILGWMIEGCLEWKAIGLTPPPIVVATTQEYLQDEDAVGRWLNECVDSSSVGGCESMILFRSWTEWANANGEYVGSMRRLVQALIGRNLARWQHPETRRNGFAGVAVKPRQDVLEGI